MVRTTTRGSNSPADLAARTNAASPINMVSVNSPTHTTTIVPVGSDGTIAFTTTSGATHLSVDVLGYLVKPAGVGETGGRLTETSTTPLYSTAATNEPLQPGEKRVVTLAQPVGVSRALPLAWPCQLLSVWHIMNPMPLWEQTNS